MAPDRSPRASRAWHEASTPRAVARPRSTRWRKVFVILAVMLALVGAIAAWLLLLSPFKEPTFLSLPLRYTEGFPVNAFAPADSDALLRHFAGGYKARDNQTKVQILQRLKSAAQEERALVVHLCGFARIERGNGSEKLCLLPGDARRDDPSTWIGVEEILDLLRKCPAKNKLLLLDITRPLTDPRRDLQPEDIAQQFQELFQSRENNNLQILCACSPGQSSQVSRELGLSVFGYYLHEGLSGQADGYNDDGKRNGRISAHELAAFVKARVDRWAIRNRGARQTPVLLGNGPDFDLVALKENETSSRWKPPSAADYLDALRQGWQRRDRWAAGDVCQVAPRLVRQLEDLLLTQEQEWRGGSDNDEILKQLTIQLGDLPRQEKAPAPKEEDKPAAKEKPPPKRDKQAAKEKASKEDDKQSAKDDKEKKPAPGPKAEPDDGLRGSLGEEAGNALAGLRRPHLASLFFEARYGLKPNAEVERELRAMLGNFDETTKPDILKKEKIQFLGKYKDVPAKEVCWTMLQLVFDDACSNRLQYQFLVDLVKAPPEYVEMVYLQRLADLGDRYPKWPGEEVRLLLQIVQVAGQARNCRPREFPWVRHLFEETEKKRRDAEQLFFTGKLADLPKARELLGEALQGYKDINRTVGTVRQAHEGFDEAFRLLPAYVPYLIAQFPEEGAEELQRAWFNAIKEVDALEVLLSRPPQAGKAPSTDQFAESLSQLDGRYGNLRKLLDQLRQPFQPKDPEPVMQVDEAGREAAMHRTIRALHEVEAGLATSCPTAPEREALLRNRLRFANKLNEDTQQLDQDDWRKERRSEVRENLLPRQNATSEREPVFRARLALALLRLAGIPEEERKKLEQALAQTQKKGTPADWDRMAVALQLAREGLREKLPQLDLVQADRLSRVLFAPSGEVGTRNPTLQLRCQQAKAYWEWLEGFYMKEADGLGAVPSYQALFRATSRVCQEGVPGDLP